MSEPTDLIAPTDDELSAEQYELILRNVHDAVYTLDQNGRITWVNDVVFEKFDLGYTREELIGAPVSELLSADDINKCVEIIADLYRSETRDSGRCEITVRTASGRDIPCDLHLALLASENGAFHGTVGVLRDIADRKRREQGQMVLNRVLRHNLRNQLNIVKGQAELLEARSTDGVDDRARSIIDAADELLRLSEKARRVDEALTAEEWPLEATDAVELVQRRCEAFETRFPAAEVSFAGPTAAWVRANPRLEIVIDNLLENAVEHADRRPPTVDVTITADTAAEDRVEVRIADEGPAIPAAELEPLSRESETALCHGSGLGLWIVKWFIDRFAGQLEFEDRSPHGNVVIVRLPSAEPP